MFKIMLDPGHGGNDPGAVGQLGTREADIVLTVARLVRDRLQTAAQVRMTRDADVRIPLAERARMANAWQADVFISFHCNAATNKQAQGFEVFTAPGQNRSDVLAEEIINAVRREFPQTRFRTDMSDGDSDKEARFTVLTSARVPAVLVEMAFISNAQEEKSLRNPNFQRRMAHTIAQGIATFLNITIVA